MPHHGFVHLLAVAAVVMGLAQTLAKERLFAPLRDRLGGKETWLGYLVSCPYCASHWIAFVVVPLTDAYYLRASPSLGRAAPVLTWFFSSIVVVVTAAFLRVAFWLVDEEQGLIRRRQRTEDEEAATRRVVRSRIATGAPEGAPVEEASGPDPTHHPERASARDAGFVSRSGPHGPR